MKKYDIKKIKRLFREGRKPEEVAQNLDISRWHLFRVAEQMGYNIKKTWRIDKSENNNTKQDRSYK